MTETSRVIKAAVTMLTKTHCGGWIRTTHLNPKAQSRTCGEGRGHRSARARKN